MWDYYFWLAERREQLDKLEQDFLAIADLLFNLHYGPALEQLSATELDAETLLTFTRESVEDVTLALGCCAKRQSAPRHDADGVDLTVEQAESSGFAFRLLAIALAFFGTVCCVQVCDRAVCCAASGVLQCCVVLPACLPACLPAWLSVVMLRLRAMAA